MTYTELQKKIARLEVELAEVKEQVAALPERVGGVFEPEYGEDYWLIASEGTVFANRWGGDSIDKDRYAIGNCFSTEQAAEDAVRALKLIQTARESQDGFVPDWEDVEQDKYTLNFGMGEVCVTKYISRNIASIFGFWEDKLSRAHFIHENREELLWFFTEYRL